MSAPSPIDAPAAAGDASALSEELSSERLMADYVLGNYGRFPLAFSRGEGAYVVLAGKMREHQHDVGLRKIRRLGDDGLELVDRLPGIAAAQPAHRQLGTDWQ